MNTEISYLQLSTPFILQGAERFAKYLDERTRGKLHRENVVICETIIIGDIYLNDKYLGYYQIFRKSYDQTEYVREYHGIVPGYSYEVFKDEPARTEVSLVFSNKKLEFKKLEIYMASRPTIVQTEWMRQDGHKEIPFP